MADGTSKSISEIDAAWGSRSGPARGSGCASFGDGRSGLGGLPGLRGPCLEADVISRQQALEVAEQACDARGFPFEEPVKVRRGLLSFRVWTKADHRGGRRRHRER